MDKNFGQNLKLTLDVLVPIVSASLMTFGIASEIYEYIHNYNFGSHAGEISSGFSVAGSYFGFLRKNFLSESKENRLEYRVLLED